MVIQYPQVSRKVSFVVEHRKIATDNVNKISSESWHGCGGSALPQFFLFVNLYACSPIPIALPPSTNDPFKVYPFVVMCSSKAWTILCGSFHNDIVLYVEFILHFFTFPFSIRHYVIIPSVASNGCTLIHGVHPSLPQ